MGEQKHHRVDYEVSQRATELSDKLTPLNAANLTFNEQLQIIFAAVEESIEEPGEGERYQTAELDMQLQQDSAVEKFLNADSPLDLR